MEDADLIKQSNESVPNVELKKETASGKKQTDNFITEIKPQKERIEWIVVLRAFACMAVVFMHMLYVKDTTGKFLFTINNNFVLVFVETIFSFAVPVFIMITGCLLLNPKHDISIVKLIRYIIKYFCLLMLFGFFYDFCYQLDEVVFNKSDVLSLSVFCKLLLNSLISFTNLAVAYHLWYLIMLINLLILTPVLRSFVKHTNSQMIKFVLLILFIATSFIPTIKNYFNFNFFEFTGLDRCMFVYLVGYVIVHTNYIKDNHLYIWGSIGIIVWFIASYLGVADQLDAFMILAAMLIVKLFSTKKNIIKSNKITSCVSKYSLGIYLIHPFWIKVIARIRVILPVLINEIIIYSCVLVLSLISSMILYRMPLIKKLFK